MIARRICLGALVLLVALATPACSGLSCSEEPGSIISPVASAGFATSSIAVAGTTAPVTSTALVTTTSSTTTTSTTSTSTTTTTLSPLEAYKVEMRAWKNEYAGDLESSYQVISTMRNMLSPSPEQIQAAQDLDALLADMVADLEDIRPPPELSSMHADYLASLKELAHGAHKLADAMEDGATLRTMTAITNIATVWSKGEPERTALEQALGFSLSKVD